MDELCGLFHTGCLHFPAVHRSSKGTKTDTDDPGTPSHDRGVSQFLSLHARHPWATGGRAIRWVGPLIVHIEVQQRRALFFLLEGLGKVKRQRGEGEGERVLGVWGSVEKTVGSSVVRGLGGSALELLEARLAHPHRLLRGRRQGVLGRALGAEDVATVPAVVLGGDREGGGGLAENAAPVFRHL